MKTNQTTDGPVELPSDFAEHIAAVSDLDAVPTTFEEWWEAVAEQYSEEEITVGLSDLYSETPTRHEVHVNGRVQYAHCALDALEAAVIEEQSPVTARSIDPVTGTPVTFTVREDSVAVSPEEALLCFGSTIDSAAVEEAGSLAAWSVQDDMSEVNASVCRYTNAFESEETYERWASETESYTAPLPPKRVVPLLRELPSERS